MIYATIDVDLQHHDKAIKAGSAMYLWTFCMLWSRSQKESGRVPNQVWIACPWGTRLQNKTAHDRLIQSGLWTDEGDHVQIWNYGKKNDTRDIIEKRVEGAKVRQASHRARSNALVTRDKHMAPGAGAGVNVSLSDSFVPDVFNPRSNLEGGQPSNGHPVGHQSDNVVKLNSGTRLTPVPPAPSASDLAPGAILEAFASASLPPDDIPNEVVKLNAEMRYQAAYATGIAKGKGGPYAWPGTRDATGSLHVSIQTFGRVLGGNALRGEALLEWIESKATEFARFVVAHDDPKYWSGYGPKGFLRWFNEGAPNNRHRDDRPSGRQILQSSVGRCWTPGGGKIEKDVI